MLSQEIQRATLAARQRTGKLIGVSVEAGKYRVEHIIPQGPTSEVVPLSEPCNKESAILFLNGITD